MSYTLWFTGLSGAGKTTLSRLVYFALRGRGQDGELLDGDIVRANFSQELGYSRVDRDINVRRLGFLSHLLNRHGVVAVVAAIAPYAAARTSNRHLLERYVEVFVDCPLAVAEARDPKGLYAKARAGQVLHFTGISDPYETPTGPELTIRTDQCSPAEGAAQVLAWLETQGLVAPATGQELVASQRAEAEDAAWRERLTRLGYAR